jgi:hypothetical protein
MKSPNASLKPVQLSFDSTPATSQPGELLFRMEMYGRLPSWNEILGMEQWQRYQFKKEWADRFLSALRQYASDSSIKTISAKSTLSIYVATLESYLETARLRRKLKSFSKKRSRDKESLLESKSSEDKVPF